MNTFVLYIQLVNKVITLCSPLVPVVAFVLRKIRLIRPKSERPNELAEMMAIAAFGFFGGAMGLVITLGGAVIIVVIIGMHFYEMQTSASFSQSNSGVLVPPLHLDDSSLVSAGASIVSTLIILGGHNKLRGIAFLAGCCFGAAIGIMVVASWVLH